MHNRNVKAFSGLLACTPLLIVGCSGPAPFQSVGSSTPSLRAAKVPQQVVTEPVWGSADASGLQMGIWKPTQEAFISCVIKNSGKRSVRYNPCFLGYWEAVSLEARLAGSSAWAKVPRRKLKNRIYESAGPAAYKTRVLLPNQKILPITGKNVPQHFAQSSFPVYLNDFDWPIAWSSGDIEIKVVQPLLKSKRDPKDTWEGTLISGSITISGRDTKAK